VGTSAEIQATRPPVSALEVVARPLAPVIPLPSVAIERRSITVTTLTPTLNEEGHIRETIAALQEQDIAADAEFIIIDGGSTDRTREIVEELAGADRRIRLLDNPQRHTASALNIGLRASRGRYVARIDAHTRYPAHYLSRGIERLQQGGVDWVAGPQIPVGADTWSRRVAAALGTRAATGTSKRWGDCTDAGQDAGEVELRTGVFTGMWERDTLVSDGGWDEGWPINQDSEMASRVLRRGGRIVQLPELGAEYTPRNSLRGLARQYRRYGMYRAKTTLRHPSTVGSPHVVLPGLVVSAVAAVTGPPVVRSLSRVGLGAYAAGIVAQSLKVADDPRDRLAMPLVFVTMHASWGAGFLAGLVRFARPSGRRLALATDLAGAADLPALPADLPARREDVVADVAAGLAELATGPAGSASVVAQRV
jgi:succinoglycan biosynthesis protein ExoA